MDALDYIKTITGLDFKKDQAPAHFNDPNSIALESIQPGVLNTLKENNIDVQWNDAEKIKSSILKLRSEVNDAKRLSGFNELRGVVVLSMTLGINQSRLRALLVPLVTMLVIGWVKIEEW